MSNYQQKYPNLYYDCDLSWYPLIDSCITEIYLALKKLQLPENFLDFEIKDKFGRLRMYYYIVDFDAIFEDSEVIDILYSQIDPIILKYEKLILQLEEEKKLEANKN